MLTKHKKPLSLNSIILALIIAICAHTPATGQPVVGAAQLGEPTVGAAQINEYLPLLEGKRVAFCGNHTSLIGSTHVVDSLLALNVDIRLIFSPEHGFRGDAEAGATIQSGKDAKTGLPIISLYGKNKKPLPEQLQGIDVIVFDIQDVGVRFYTYISTMHYVMEAAAENHIPMIVLDRPNPNGYFVDGPVMKPQFRSFIGKHCVPVVHGMTIGEYARMVNGEGWLSNGVKCELTVIPVAQYTHNTRYSLPVPPSPNLQSDESVYLYASLCLFEGTFMSVGRGTDKPFQIFGHPDLQYGDYYFTPVSIKGVSENPPHKGRKCRGVDLTDYAHSMLDSTNCFTLRYIIEAYQHFPNKEEFFSRNNFFSKLAGNNEMQQQIMSGMTESQIRTTWQKDLAQFKEIRKKYLLYPDFE